MEQGKEIPLDQSLTVNAAKFGLEHKLPLVDSIIYVTGQKYNAMIWTQDDDFKSLEGVRYYSKAWL